MTIHNINKSNLPIFPIISHIFPAPFYFGEAWDETQNGFQESDATKCEIIKPTNSTTISRSYKWHEK